MPPAPTAVPAETQHLYTGYQRWLTARGVGNRPFDIGARTFLARFPDPQGWAALPLAERHRTAKNHVQPFLNFLMLHGHLHPGYDWLLDRKFHAILREGAASPLGADIARFLGGAETLGYSVRTRTGMASEVVARMLIQTGRSLDQLTDADFAEFEAAIGGREARNGRDYKHYRTGLHGARAVVYHLGAPAEPAPKRSTLWRWSWERHLEGVGPHIRGPMVAYLERLRATLSRSSVQSVASELAHFGRFLARTDPGLKSLALLDRRRHIEPYLSEVADAINHRTGAPIAASTAKGRILTVGRFLDAMAEWGWPDAPPRRLVFPRDAPRLPHPLPRYLPPDHDRLLVEALEASPNRLRADALLLLRATGMRIGELCDLELDCVHEVPGQGAWLKVPLGKLLTERMVPLDDETVELIDRIVARRSPGRPLRHPRTGRLVEFLLTHQGRRVSACTLRDELHRAAADAGLGSAVPHQLRHTYATALVNAGCSLQALMALLGHVSAEMSLRYGRLFDATVRESYERALTLAKAQLGPVLPEATPVTLQTDWRAAPMIKSRLAGGYCLRSLAQGPCAYTHVCEHCPNFRTDHSFLPMLVTQRADAAKLVADAEGRGWGEEAARHRRLIERLDRLIAGAEAS
ncbi:MAG TPA: tyrosine-type recombinase/integrase [Acidimicrobiales bacterium]|nr:tyrosine-type recombinase/integrase [Acidimicrobiales bacterium]